MKPELGEISSGTMRTQDLLPAFLEALEEYGEKEDLDHFRSELSDIAADSEDWEEFEERREELLMELRDALDTLSPPYCYFGSNEGDGSCYGWWVSMDAVETAVQDGEIEKVEDWPSPWKGEPDYKLYVNDHGNCTLVSSDGKEVWGIV